jgi:para-nitrobenzyl esterase
MALAAFHKTKAEDYLRGRGTLSGRPSQTEMQGMSRYRGAGYANMYDAIIQNAKLAQRAGGIIKGIIVHQGESGPGLNNIDWDELLKEIYDDMLSDLGLPPDSIPILLGQTWNGGSGNTGGALRSNEVIQSILPNAWVISSVGATGRTGQGQPDNIHFGSDGIQLLGTRYAEKMLELVYR